MTPIKASCPVDGEVEITSDDVTLHVCEQRPALSTYRFDCPVCRDQVVKQADQHIVALLRGACVAVRDVRLPAEAVEPRPGGDPISYDDLLDFHFELEATDFLAPLAMRRRP